MKKNIKCTIGTMLVISAFSGTLSAKDFMFGNIEVYAATYNAASKGELSSLSIMRGNNELELRDSYDGDKISLSSKSDYYLELKGSDRKTNTWRNNKGKIQYIDGTGESLKNKWWFDKSTGISYYLKEDGDRAKGWLQDKNYWYYFNQDGEIKTGWISVDNNWYYLNKGGAMKTGWFEDIDGNWYYLDSTGKMIKDSTIDGFKLGVNGALVN